MFRALCIRGVSLRLAFPVLILLGVLCHPSAGHAEVRWTQPTPQELAMTSEPKAPGAAAIYLYREEITNESDKTESFYVRLKILTDAGRSYADVALDYIDNNYGFTFSVVEVAR